MRFVNSNAVVMDRFHQWLRERMVPPPLLLPRLFALFSLKIAESNDNDMPGMILYSLSLNDTPHPPTSQRGKCSSKLHQKLPLYQRKRK